MLEGPEFPGAAEAGLDFVKGQDEIWCCRHHSGKLTNEFDGWRNRATDALGIRFHDHAGDVLRLHAARFDGGEEGVEAGVGLPIAVGERRGDDRGVFIDDPRFLAGHTAGLLRAEGAPVKTAFPADDADLLIAADFDPVGAAQFDRALGGLRTGGKQENFLQTLGRDFGEAFDECGAFFVGEDVAVQQAAVDLVDDGLTNLGCGMAAGIRDEHARRPIEPTVAVFVA